MSIPTQLKRSFRSFQNKWFTLQQFEWIDSIEISLISFTTTRVHYLILCHFSTFADVIFPFFVYSVLCFDFLTPATQQKGQHSVHFKRISLVYFKRYSWSGPISCVCMRALSRPSHRLLLRWRKMPTRIISYTLKKRKKNRKWKLFYEDWEMFLKNKFEEKKLHLKFYALKVRIDSYGILIECETKDKHRFIEWYTVVFTKFDFYSIHAKQSISFAAALSRSRLRSFARFMRPNIPNE